MNTWEGAALVLIAVCLMGFQTGSLIFTFTSAPVGNIRYVDSNQSGYNGASAPSGVCAAADAGFGTSPAAPWCTMQKVSAVQATLVADERVIFKGGSTWHEQLNLTNTHGTAGHPVFIGNDGTYGSGRAIINGQGARSYCVDSLSGTRHDITISGFECTQFTLQGITFQGTGGAGGYAPGITYLSDYVHDGGPGKFAGATVGPDSFGYCLPVGRTSITNPGNEDCNGNPQSPGTITFPAVTAGACDDCGYTNALDFDDFGSGLGIDGVHMISNTVQNVGGHNCLQVHYDGGDGLVQSNIVGPGCDHNGIDIKGAGTLGSHTTQADSNIITTGTNAAFTAANASACMYDENTFNAASSVLWTKNVCYTAAGTLGNYGYQETSSGSCSHAHCTQNVTLYNNTIKTTNGSTWEDCIAVGDSFNPADTTAIVKNNICEGGTASVHSGVVLTWDYNDDGGKQGKSSAYSGISTGAHDVVNVDPLYLNFAGNNYQIYADSPVATAGLAGTGTGLVSMGAYAASASSSPFQGVYDLTNFNSTVPASITSNSSIDGCSIRITGWSTVEPSDGVFDWSLVDSMITKCAGKKIVITLPAGYTTPSWVYSAGAASFPWIWDANFGPALCSTATMPIPWDTVFQSKWAALIAAFGAKYGSNPNIVAIHGTGPLNSKDAEILLPHKNTQYGIGSGGVTCNGTPGFQCCEGANDTNWKNAGYTRTKMESAGDWGLDQLFTAFPNKRIVPEYDPCSLPAIDASGNIFPTPGDCGDTTGAYDLINYGRATYGNQKFVWQNDGLSTSPYTELATMWNNMLAATTGAPVVEDAFQFDFATGSGTNFNTKMSTGISKGAKAIEAYETDLTNPSNATEITTAHNGLLANTAPTP